MTLTEAEIEAIAAHAALTFLATFKRAPTDAERAALLAGLVAALEQDVTGDAE